MQDAAEAPCLGDNLYFFFAYRPVKCFFSFFSLLSLDVLITAAVFFPSFLFLLIALHCCDSFCCTAKWISYTHTCCALFSHSVVFKALQRHGLKPARLLCPWGFSRQEYWRGLPCPPPGDLPNPGIEPRSPILQADSLPFGPPGKLMNIDSSQLLTAQECVFLIQPAFTEPP